MKTAYINIDSISCVSLQGKNESGFNRVLICFIGDRDDYIELRLSDIDFNNLLYLLKSNNKIFSYNMQR